MSDQGSKLHVRIQGHYASELALAGVTRRLFHYRVEIDRQGVPLRYERDLHLSETGPTRQDAITAPVASPAHTPSKETTPPDRADTASSPQPTLAVAQANPQRTPAWTAVPWARLIAYGQARYRTSLARLKAITARPRANKPLPMRRLFGPRSRSHAGKALLALCVVGIAALVFYRQHPVLPPSLPQAHAPGYQPIADSKTGEAAYHARIETKPDGVLITLHGPDHAEVLTRLPPGYSPTIEGNKIVHVVTPGNTLWFIAKRYIKNPYRYPELARLNRIKNPDRIYPGDKVIIQYIQTP